MGQVELLKETDLTLKRVLILGPLNAGRWISAELKELGFETQLQEALSADESCPVLQSPFHPWALESLREVLAFWKKSNPPNSPAWVHPGVGHWAKRPELPVLTQELGLELISTTTRILALFGDQLHFILEAEKHCGVPHLILSPEPYSRAHEIESAVKKEQYRFPIILKPLKSDDSRAAFVLNEVSELEKKLPLWLEQARLNLGEPILFLERHLEGARHVTVPFARTRQGEIEWFPWVDSSLQSRFRKLVEFCPMESVEPEIQSQVKEWSRRMLEYFGYVGVGALEYLVDGSRAFLIRSVAHLDRSFPLWESVSGARAVAWQLYAQDPSLVQPALLRRETVFPHALSAAIRSEDTVFQMPQPGLLLEAPEITEWDFPGAQASLHLNQNLLENRQDCFLSDPGEVASLLVSSQSREQSLKTVLQVLKDTWIAGSLQTNERFLKELLNHPWVQAGVFHAGFVDEEFVPRMHPPSQSLPLFAEIAATALPAASKSVWMVGDQWVRLGNKKPSLRWVKGPEVSEKGQVIRGWIENPMEEGGGALRIHACPILPGQLQRWQVKIDQWVLPVKYLEKPGKIPMEMTALATGKVHAIFYQQRADIPAHEYAIIVESLGMLIPHAFPVSVMMSTWKVKTGDAVVRGQVLGEFEILEER